MERNHKLIVDRVIAYLFQINHRHPSWNWNLLYVALQLLEIAAGEDQPTVAGAD
jgi:hypothetical protein